MIMRIMRWGLSAGALLCLIGLYFLPQNYPASPNQELDALPDADLAALAESHWANGYRESAISILDYALEQADQDRADGKLHTGMQKSKPLLEQLRSEYNKTLADEESLDGRLWKLGSGAITGKIDSWESMAGSTAADLFVVGDIRDVVVEGLIADDTDELILTLSAVGILTTAWPPADPAVSMLKAAKKSDAISEPVVNQLMKVSKNLKDAPSGKTQQAFIDTVEPLWKMGNKCSSWSQFKLLMKHSDTIDHVKTVNKVMEHGPQRAKQLNRAFAICHKSTDSISSMFKILNKSGQKSCDAIYAVIRKGPPGVKWLAKRPKLWARLGKIAYKDGSFGYNYALKHFGKQVQFLRFTAMMACVLILLCCSPLRRLLRKKKDTEKRRSFSTLKLSILVVVVSIAFGIVAASLVDAPQSHLSIAAPSKPTILQQVYQHTREIRVRLQEYDTVDPSDEFIRTSQVPLVQSSDGSHWLLCSRRALGLDWPEFNDGDVNVVKYIISKRGPDPSSAFLTTPFYVYKDNPDYCLVPYPKDLPLDQAPGPRAINSLDASERLFLLAYDKRISGVCAKSFSSSTVAIGPLFAIDASKAQGLGDYLLDSQGRLVGYFENKHLAKPLPVNVDESRGQAFRCQEPAEDGYYHNFVSDVKSTR